jgi:hypothetical protein
VPFRHSPTGVINCVCVCIIRCAPSEHFLSLTSILTWIDLLIMDELDQKETAVCQACSHDRAKPIDPVITWELAACDGATKAPGRVSRTACEIYSYICFSRLGYCSSFLIEFQFHEGDGGVASDSSHLSLSPHHQVTSPA